MWGTDGGILSWLLLPHLTGPPLSPGAPHLSPHPALALPSPAPAPSATDDPGRAPPAPLHPSANCFSLLPKTPFQTLHSLPGGSPPAQGPCLPLTGRRGPVPFRTVLLGSHSVSYPSLPCPLLPFLPKVPPSFPWVPPVLRPLPSPPFPWAHLPSQRQNPTTSKEVPSSLRSPVPHAAAVRWPPCLSACPLGSAVWWASGAAPDSGKTRPPFPVHTPSVVPHPAPPPRVSSAISCHAPGTWLDCAHREGPWGAMGHAQADGQTRSRAAQAPGAHSPPPPLSLSQCRDLVPMSV